VQTVLPARVPATDPPPSIARLSDLFPFLSHRHRSSLDPLKPVLLLPPAVACLAHVRTANDSSLLATPWSPLTSALVRVAELHSRTTAAAVEFLSHALVLAVQLLPPLAPACCRPRRRAPPPSDSVSILPASIVTCCSLWRVVLCTGFSLGIPGRTPPLRRRRSPAQ
jgi:hypothetical protein